MIIGLVGEKLAGKDTAANYLVKNYGADHFRFTHILDEVLKDLNLPISRKNEIDLGLSLRKVFGDHVLANALERRIKKSSAKINVVNGIRMDEMDVVKSWGAKIIYVTSPIEIRFERNKTRREKADDGQMNFEAFAAVEKGPTEVRIPELGKRADFKIENSGTVEEYYSKIDDIMKQLNLKKE